MPPTETLSELPNKFAEFFLNKIQKIKEHFQDQIHINHTIGNVQNSLALFLLKKKNEILSIIKKMNPTICIMGPCNTRLLLKFKGIILDSITTIVNQSITSGTFLEDWKIASVRPLIKGLNLDTELINYRPISNLCFLPKIIEKAAQTQLQKHFDNQSLLPTHQVLIDKIIYSMEITLLDIYDNILKNMENQKCTSVVSMDLSAVFDTVNHKILLDVLKNYFEITEQALAWISSYFSNRKFLVQIGQFTSKIVTINFSIPQGSILGPILLNCYASTLTEIIPESNDSFLSGYADDHAIVNSFNPDKKKIKQKLEKFDVDFSYC